MSKILDWIKKHKKIAVFIALGVFILPLIAVDYIVDVYLSQISPSSKWNASNLISYITGFESLLGSVILGLVAVYQNVELGKVNKQMLDNEVKRDKFARQPCVMLSGWGLSHPTFRECLQIMSSLYACGVFDPHLDEQVIIIELSLINATNFFTELSVRKLLFSNGENIELPFCHNGSVLNPQGTTVLVAPGKTTILHFILSQEHEHALHGSMCKLELSLINSIGEKYIEAIPFTILYHNGPFILRTDPFIVRERV